MALGLPELIAISLGGMIGGGIFSILGVAVEQVGNAAPVAIAIGAALAFVAARSYAKLAQHFEDEGATYSFFKLTYPESHHAAAAIGWIVVFGYISTLALYAYTFASYLATVFPQVPAAFLRPVLSAGVLSALVLLNIVSVELMGRVEDLMVYSKLGALALVTIVLFATGAPSNALPVFSLASGPSGLFFVAALTFVAFEGFQLAIHAYTEVSSPRKNVPRAIYLSIGIAALLYVLMAEGALWALDKPQIIEDKEFALAAGAAVAIGPAGYALVIASALLATASAINGTLFGASRLMAIIADDGYLPAAFSRRMHGHTPAHAVVALAASAWLLVQSGGLELILEFGSLTFIIVSLLMAVANLKLREQTGTSLWSALAAVASLTVGALLILIWQAQTEPSHLAMTVVTGGIVGALSARYASTHHLRVRR